MQKEEIYKKFEELDKVAALGGGVVRIDKQHEAGRMTPVNELICCWIKVRLLNWISS